MARCEHLRCHQSCEPGSALSLSSSFFKLGQTSLRGWTGGKSAVVWTQADHQRKPANGRFLSLPVTASFHSLPAPAAVWIDGTDHGLPGPCALRVSGAPTSHGHGHSLQRLDPSACRQRLGTVWPSRRSERVFWKPGRHKKPWFVRPASIAGGPPVLSCGAIAPDFCTECLRVATCLTGLARSQRRQSPTLSSSLAHRVHVQPGLVPRFSRYVKRRPGEAFEVHIVIGRKLATEQYAPVDSLQDSRASSETTALLRIF